MSSTISPKELKSLPAKMNNKARRLSRTSSMEKIKRFNSYICTQHYYIIPALLAWLRSSQDILHETAKKSILNVRSMILTTFIQLDVRSISHTIIVQPLQRLLEHLHQLYIFYQVETMVLKFLVGLTVVTLASQVGFFLFVIFSTTVPFGLGFLLICCLYIGILYSKATFFFMSSRTERSSRNKLKMK